MILSRTLSQVWNATTAKLINAEKILNGCVKIVACISVTMARRKTAS